jgi:hypothetical protein
MFDIRMQDKGGSMCMMSEEYDKPVLLVSIPFHLGMHIPQNMIKL